MKPLRIRASKTFFPEFVAPLEPVNVPVARCTAGSREQARRRVLVTRTGANGDILMGTPFLAALREQWPDCHITWMVERKEREAIDANPYVDEILLWDSKYWKKMTRSGLYPIWAVHALRFYKILGEKKFDVFVSYQPEDWPTLVRSLAAHGATARIGIFDTFREYNGQTQTSKRARLYTTVYPYETHPPHRVDQYLLPLQALGLQPPRSKRLIMGYTQADATDVDGYIESELHNKPFVVVAPLTGWPSRVWPLERFAHASDEIARATGAEIVLVSGPSPKDCAQVDEVASQMQFATPHRATGRFGFRALAALIERAALVLSGDTGPMHLCSMFGTPYVALFGPSPVERFAPLVGRGLPLVHSVPCGPCHQYSCHNEGDAFQLCMKLLTVPEVVEASLRLIRNPDQAVSGDIDEPCYPSTPLLSDAPVLVPTGGAS